jgi:hypothetical protein
MVVQSPNKPQKTIWDKIEEITKDVPDEVWEELPADGAENHDFYLYGTPQKIDLKKEYIE